MTNPDIQIEAILNRYNDTLIHREMTKAIQLLADGILALDTSDFKTYRQEISARYIDQPEVRADFTSVCRLLCECISDYATSKLEASDAPV